MTHKPPFDLYIASCCPDGGVLRYRIDFENGARQLDFLPLDRPMYMALTQDKLYVLLRQCFPEDQSGLTVCDLAEGQMRLSLSVQPTMGKVACHLCVTDEDVYAANYVSGSVVKMPGLLRLHHGSSVHPTRQASAHAHCIIPTPDGKYLLAADLGLDKIFVYTKDLIANTDIPMPAGCGPRHLVFHDDGKHVFCANELDSTVSVLRYRDGELKLLSTASTLPEDFMGSNTAGAIRCLGDRVYVSNRGHDSVAELAFDGVTLKLLRLIPTQGSCPRDLLVFRDLLICANQLSNDVTFIDLQSGQLLHKLSVKTPLCLIAR